MAERQCEVCGCTFRPDGDEKRCKAHLNTELTPDQKLRKGMEIEGIKETLSPKEIEDLIEKKIDEAAKKLFRTKESKKPSKAAEKKKADKAKKETKKEDSEVE